MDNKYLLIPIANPTIGATLVPCHVSLIPWVLALEAIWSFHVLGEHAFRQCALCCSSSTTNSVPLKCIHVYTTYMPCMQLWPPKNKHPVLDQLQWYHGMAPKLQTSWHTTIPWSKTMLGWCSLHSSEITHLYQGHIWWLVLTRSTDHGEPAIRCGAIKHELCCCYSNKCFISMLLQLKLEKQSRFRILTPRINSYQLMEDYGGKCWARYMAVLVH